MESGELKEDGPANAVVESTNAELLNEEALMLEDARAGAKAVGHKDVHVVHHWEGCHVLHHHRWHAIDELAIIQPNSRGLLYLDNGTRALRSGPQLISLNPNSAVMPSVVAFR